MARGPTPSFLEELLFIGGLVFGVSLLVAGILRLRLIQRVNQVSARARAILKADNWTARVAKDGAGQDLSELSDAVNGLLEVADASQRELRESERRLAAQSQALTELTSRQTGASVTVGDRLRLILETCARTLEVARVSTWRFEENGAAHALRRPVSDRHRPALVGRTAVRARRSCLFQRHRPRACRRGDRCATPIRGRASSATSYLTPHGIGAMLDVPLRQEDRPLGVLCTEQSAAPRAWTVDEQNFALSVANLVVVAAGRRGAARRRCRTSGRERGARAAHPRHGARRVHRHGLRRPRSSRWNAQADGDVRLDARRSASAAAAGHDHPAGVPRRRTSKAAPVPRHRRGAGRQPAARAARRCTAPAASFPIEITITSPMRVGGGYFFGAFLRDISERLRARRRAAAGQGDGRSRDARQERVPRQHEPRAAHAAQRRASATRSCCSAIAALTPQQREALDAISASAARICSI